MNAWGEFAAHAGGADDQAFAVFFEEFLVDAGLVIEAFERCFGGEFHQVLVADLIFGEGDEVVIAVAFGVPVGAFAGRHVHFTANKWVYACLLALLIELERAVHHAVVGQGDGGHVVVFGVLDDVLDLARAPSRSERIQSDCAGGRTVSAWSDGLPRARFGRVSCALWGS